MMMMMMMITVIDEAASVIQGSGRPHCAFCLSNSWCCGLV